MEPQGSADGGWPRPGLKALSTLSLGIYNNRTYPSTSIFRSKKSFEHTINPFEPIAAENLRFNPNPEHLLECLKVCMMNLGPTQQIPLQQNYAVNVLLETLADTFRDVNAKDKQVEAVKAEAKEAKKHLEEHAEAWNVLEANYKKELRSLEVLVAGGKRELEYGALARTISDLQNHKEEFRKTSNLSSVTTSGKGHENASELKKHSEDLRKTKSNLSSGTASGNGDENGSPRQEAKSKIIVSTNQVFDHRRISRPPNDKLFADFGTIMDSELSKTIQQNEDALAGAAKERWLEARRRAGHTVLSSSSGSDEEGLGLTIYDPPMVPSFHAPLPPPIIVEPEGNDNSDEDEGDDDSEELVKISGGGYMMKPPKKRGAGGRAKSFFGLSKRKVLEFQNSDSSSASSSDSDDRGPRRIARAIASAHFMATIASPMLGIEQATTPPKKIGGLQPPKHTFKNKKKTSYANLPALAQQFMNGMKDTSRKSDDSNRPEQPTRLNTKYNKSVSQLHHIVLSEGLEFSKELKPHTDALPLAHGHEGKENMLHAMSDQANHKFSAGLHSDSDKTATAQYSVSSLRHEYVLDDDDENNVPTYGKSNSVRGSFEERRTDSNLSSLPRTTSSLGLGIVAQGQTKGDFQMPPQHPQLHSYADGGFATIHSRPIAPDRVYDPRILRKPSLIAFDDGAAQSGEGGQQKDMGTNQKVLRDRVKSYKDERDEVEAASRRVLMRASGRKFNDPQPANWDQGQPRRETFHESVIRRQSGAHNGGHGGPSSAVSVATALYDPRDSILGKDCGDHLIHGRSERGGISDAYACLTANASSSIRETGPGRAAEQNAMPYSLSSWALESIRERDEELANSRRMERESMSSVASSVASSMASSHRRQKSIRGKENFLASLRNAVLPLKSKFGRKAGHPDLPNTVSSTSLSGENSKVSKGDAFVVAVPRHPYADPVPTFTSRIESDRSGESPHNRPVTAIFQGLQTSSARCFSFTPANGREFSASTKQVVHQSPKNTEAPARSWRNPFDGSEKRVYFIETARDSLETIRRKSSGLDGRIDSSRPPSLFLAGGWRKVGSDEYDSDALTSRITTRSLKDTTARRREVSRQSSGAEGSRVDSAAPTTALTYQDSNERLPAPQMPQVQNESSTLRRGCSEQCGRNGSSMPSGKSTTSLRKSLAERQATDEQEKPLKIANATAVQEKPSHARGVHTSSIGSVITVLRQEEPQRPPTPPSKDQHEPTKFHPESSGQYGRIGFSMPSGKSMNSLRQNVTERKSSVEQGEAVKSLAVATKVVGKKPSHDRVVRTSSTGSIILDSEQKHPDRPPPPTKFGSNPNKQHREDSGQQGKDANTRISAGLKPPGHTGQRQASGEQKQTINVAVNPALAAARSVVEAAAKKKLAEEAEKK